MLFGQPPFSGRDAISTIRAIREQPPLMLPADVPEFVEVDVACTRAGSLDSAIRDAQRGEVNRIRTRAPGIRLVGFNGRTAARAEHKWREAGYATLVLPSSSPAYTRPFAEKLAAWRAIGAFLEPVSD